jgi:hypothetical protein
MILCAVYPDPDADNNVFYLNNSLSSVKSNYIEFAIRKCNNLSRAAENKSICATDTDIDNFVYDLQVDEWVVYDEMDSEKYF